MTKPRRRQSGEGGIILYQTKAGVRYAIKYRVPREDGPARQVLLRRTRAKEPMTTRKQAAEELRAILSELSLGTHVAPHKTTLGEWLDQWLDSLRLAPSTMASYRKNVRLHIKPKLGAVPLVKLTGTKITTLYRDLERSGRQDHQEGTALSARTVRYVHTILKAALREAVAQGLIATNPATRRSHQRHGTRRHLRFTLGLLVNCQPS